MGEPSACTLLTEQKRDYRSIEESEAQIGRFIERVCHAKRLHSSLGYLPPAEFEFAPTTTQVAATTEELTLLAAW